MNVSNAPEQMKKVVWDDTGNLGKNTSGLIFPMAWGATVPADTTAGYAVGCLFIHTDGGDNTMLYINEGSGTSCDFNAVTAA